MPTRKIILADDESYVTTTLAMKLRKQGDEVSIANNGDEAFNLAVENPPDLIVTDFQMPVMSGYEMSVKLKSDPRTTNVPVLMLTARGHLLSQDDLAKTNIRALFNKPFSAKDLVAKVNEVLTKAA